MQFHQLCLRTQTMTSLFPQPQKPNRKWSVVTAPFPTPTSPSGFMMCQWVLRNKVHPKAPMIACPPKLFVGNSMTLFQHMLGPFKEVVQHPLFMIYQNPVLLTSQVHPKYCQGSRFMTSPHLRGSQRSWFMQFHPRRNPSPEFSVIPPVNIYPWSAGVTQAMLMNSKGCVFSEWGTSWPVHLSMTFKEVGSHWRRRTTSEVKPYVSLQQTVKESAQPPAPPPAPVTLWF